MFAVATIAAAADVHSGHAARIGAITALAKTTSVRNWIPCLILVYRESIPPKYSDLTRASRIAIQICPAWLSVIAATY